MRMIDAGHWWAKGTLDNNNNQLRRFGDFADTFDVPLDLSQAIGHPPRGTIIPLLWCMEHYVLQPSSRSSSGKIAFNSARAIRSAVSSYHTWEASLLHPEHGYRDSTKRTHLGPTVIPTDGLAASLTTEGMARRLGTEVRPSISLLQRHVLWNQRYRGRQFDVCDPSDLRGRYTWAAANVAEAFAWLGWLRASDVFNIAWDDVSACLPEDHATKNFPEGAGGVFLRLLESTKSDQTKQADLVLAYCTAAGVELGRWLGILRELSVQLGMGTGLLFRHPDGTAWSSHYFRHNHLYPLLTLQRLAGDPFLRAFDGSPGNTIAEKFYSMHSYRNGGRTSVNRRREGCVRAAHPNEVEEHGRWKLRHSGKERLSLHYSQPTDEDRLYITLLCM